MEGWENTPVGRPEGAPCPYHNDYEHGEGFNVIVWGTRAEGLTSYLTKGTRIYVEGETRTRSWEGEDGQRRYRTEVVANEVLLLGSAKGSDSGSNEDHVPNSEEDSIPF